MHPVFVAGTILAELHNTKGTLVNNVDPDQMVCILKSLQIRCQSYFVCVEVLRSSQPIELMSSMVSLPNHTFTGQA